MKRNVWYFLIVLMALAGFSACINDENGVPENDESKKTTYVGLTITLPSESALKAEPEDYNPVGNYAGNTGIFNVDIYLLSGDGNTLLSSARYEGSTSNFGFSSSSGSYVLTLLHPFKTTPGDKQMIVVINSPETFNQNAVPSDSKLYQLSSGVGSLSLSDLAQVSTDPASQNQDGTYADILVLSGKTTAAFTILDDISPQDVAGGQNVMPVNVTRVPSRVIVTTTASSSVGTLGTISNVTYSVAQGANSVYLFPQKTSGAISTWGYGYVPTASSYSSQASTYYDYTDLSNSSAVPAKPAQAGKEVALPGKFLLENTHVVGDAGTSQYRKGNTAYVLIRATFTPTTTIDGGTLTGGTFYVGATDGGIYSSVAAARDVANGGTANQDVYEYTNGKVLYYVWLNPDNITKPVNSPVIRNNIYHINIASFKSIGFNWNPLVPPGPTNPDPKPTNPTEPTDPPVKPEEPLSSSDTYMSVNISVLPWVVHSYDIDL